MIPVFEKSLTKAFRLGKVLSVIDQRQDFFEILFWLRALIYPCLAAFKVFYL